MRITVACPVGMADDANDFAMVMAFGPDDALTYSPPEYEDGDGARYYAASFDARPEWIMAAQSTIDRPEWDSEPYKVNMAGANRAQDALVFFVPNFEDDLEPPKATPGKLTAIGGLPGLRALEVMGLTRVPSETL